MQANGSNVACNYVAENSNLYGFAVQLFPKIAAGGNETTGGSLGSDSLSINSYIAIGVGLGFGVPSLVVALILIYNTWMRYKKAPMPSKGPQPESMMGQTREHTEDYLPRFQRFRGAHTI